MDNVQIRLKELRLRLGMTQTEIAEKLGMKQATYQKLESGKTPDMRISTLVHICKTLEVSSDWLLDLNVNNQKDFYTYVTSNFDKEQEKWAKAMGIDLKPGEIIGVYNKQHAFDIKEGDSE